MEKQITTVYVPTDEAPYFIVKDVEKEFIKARVTETKAYLYTPEEHAAAQQALSKAEDKGDNKWDKLNKEFETALEQASSNGYFENMKQPTNSLDELERWVKENWFGANEDDMTYHENVIEANDLLAKIQELKTITT